MTDEKFELLGELCEDGIRRWQSRHVGDWLDIRSDPARCRPWTTSMRALILNNVLEFRRHGDLRPGGGWGEYLLNFKQVLLVCLLAKTKSAEEIRMDIFEVFERAFNGGLATAPRDRLQTLQRLATRNLPRGLADLP